MQVHWCQHAAHEGLGVIEPWLREQGHTLACTRLYAGEQLPAPAAYDWLILMGGPANVDETDRYPWLLAHKRNIRAALDAGKRLLGICLGAQLIADALGANVGRNRQPEIGWYDVRIRPQALEHPLFCHWPLHFSAFHWHGDTFAIPAGGEWIAHSEACAHQGFVWGERVVGLQFHPEVTDADIDAWLAANLELRAGPGIQSVAQMRAGSGPQMHAAMRNLLVALAVA